jgi:serine/threonine protein kinase
MRTRAARYFGAAKKAVLALRHYYEHELASIKALDPASQPDPEFPYPTEYTSLQDDTIQKFKYLSHLDTKKLIFSCRTDNDDICVKFVRRYAAAAHLKCASLGFAPALRGFAEIAGGWFMVVMDFLGELYQDLADSPSKASFSAEIKEKIVQLHQAGYVHGDIRATNVLVRYDGRPGIMLVDFDWAGVAGDVRYPPNVNRTEIKRPNGVYDGELIKAEHDIAMIDFMFG